MELIDRDKTSFQALFPTPVYVSEIEDAVRVNAGVVAAVHALKAECDARGLGSPDDYVHSWTTDFFKDVVLKRDQRFAEERHGRSLPRLPPARGDHPRRRGRAHLARLQRHPRRARRLLRPRPRR